MNGIDDAPEPPEPQPEPRFMPPPLPPPLPPSPPPPVPLRDLPDWILRRSTETDDGGRVVLDGIARSLVAAGVPLRLMGLGAASLSAAHRGVTLTWRPGSAVEVAFTGQDAAGEMEYERSPIAAAIAAGQRTARWNLARGEGCEAIPRLGALRAQGFTDYVLDVVAFPPGTALRGVGLFHATDRLGGFGEADLSAIRALRDVCGLAVLRFGLSRALANMLKAYVGPRTAARVLMGEVRRGEGELVPAAILLADLKGFTALADRADPLRLVGWLDEHLDALGREVGRRGGEIFKFTGDGFIAAFPSEEAPRGEGEQGGRAGGEAGDALPCAACAAALAAARAGLARNRALEAARRAAGEPWLAADLALHFGPVVYGNIGTAERLDFTAIGRAVNEASRIEHLCDATGRNLLASDSFARRCGAGLVDLGTFPLRGVAAPQRLWTVEEA